MSNSNKIKEGYNFWMLKLTMTWLWDATIPKHILLPRLWKIQNVEIGETFEVKQNQWSRNASTILVHKILTAKNKLDTFERVEINHPSGDFSHDEPKRWSFDHNPYKRFFFFKTKQEAEQKLLSLRPDVEKYVQMQVEMYRNATMKKIDKMNKTLEKLGNMEKGLKK